MTPYGKYGYKVNLVGIDVDKYLQNPAVTEGYDYSPGNAIGNARIMSGKRQVHVDYFDQSPAYPHTISTSIMSGYDPDKRKTVDRLMGLAIIPLREYQDDDGVEIVKDDMISRARMRLRRRASEQQI